MEDNVFRPLVIGTAALAIAGSSIVFAQQRYFGPRGSGDFAPRFQQRYHLSAEDMAAFADARIAALRAGLELNADQAKNWPVFEQALRDLAQLRIERRQARENADHSGSATAAPTTPFDRLERRADRMAKTSAALKRVADAGAPLYQSLNDAQKNRFKILARMLRPHRHRFAFNEGNGTGGWREQFGSGGGRRGEWRSFQDRQFGENDVTPSDQSQSYTESGNEGSEL
jgi:zinc resistance-associated protein